MRRGPYDRGAWTDEKVDRLIALHRDGYSCAQITGQLNEEFGQPTVTRNAVIGKLHRLNLYREPRAPRERKARSARVSGINRGKIKALQKAPKLAPVIDLAQFATPVNGTGIPFLERAPLQCSWETGPQMVCGHAVTHPRFSWCPHHCEIGLVKPERPATAPAAAKPNPNEAAFR